MPAVVLIHGSWHGAWCWDGVAEVLRGRGVSVIAVELPFTGFDDDVAVTRAAIVKAGAGAVVCAHSYGGAVATEAASGIAGLARLVYATAFMIDQGEEVFELLAAAQSPLLEAVKFDEDSVWVDPARVVELFYGASPVEAATRAATRMRPMSSGGVAPVLTRLPAWRSTPSTFITCTRDRSIPLALQQQMATRADEVIEWDSDHSPFLARADELAAVILSYT